MVATLPEASDRPAPRTDVSPLIGTRSGSPCPGPGQATPTPPGERPRYGPGLHDCSARAKGGPSWLGAAQDGMRGIHQEGPFLVACGLAFRGVCGNEGRLPRRRGASSPVSYTHLTLPTKRIV